MTAWMSLRYVSCASGFRSPTVVGEWRFSS